MYTDFIICMQCANCWKIRDKHFVSFSGSRYFFDGMIHMVLNTSFGWKNGQVSILHTLWSKYFTELGSLTAESKLSSAEFFWICMIFMEQSWLKKKKARIAYSSQNTSFHYIGSSVKENWVFCFDSVVFVATRMLDTGFFLAYSDLMFAFYVRWSTFSKCSYFLFFVVLNFCDLHYITWPMSDFSSKFTRLCEYF